MHWKTPNTTFVDSNKTVETNLVLAEPRFKFSPKFRRKLDNSAKTLADFGNISEFN